MATFIMLPDGVTGTNEWKNPSHGTCSHTNVDSDDGDTDYCYETQNSHEVTFTLAAPGVAEASIDSITSVQVKLSAAYSDTNVGVTRFTSTQTGGMISNGFSTHNVSSGNSYSTYSGVAETTFNGTNAWTYGALGDLQIKLDKVLDVTARTILKVSYLYVEVTYVEAGYGNDVIGVDSDDIAKVNGIASANIAKVNGV